jgi:hypothetical protein
MELEGFFSRPQLRERGWTPALIRKFLRQHDIERGHNVTLVRGKKTYGGRFFYLVSRVEVVEASAEFKVAKTHSDARRKNGQPTSAAP